MKADDWLWRPVNDTDQDVNQQQLLGVPTLGLQEVLHTLFSGIRCETTAVSVQTVIHLHQQHNENE